MPAGRPEGMSEPLGSPTVREPVVPVLDAAGDDENMGVASPPMQEGHVLTEETHSDAKDGSALRQQIALPSITDQRTLPPEALQMLAIHAPGEAWALECEARNREYDLRCKAAGARCVAAEDERARLAPEEL